MAFVRHCSPHRKEDPPQCLVDHDDPPLGAVRRGDLMTPTVGWFEPEAMNLNDLPAAARGDWAVFKRDPARGESARL
jgi:hypothetical protein